MDAPAPLIVIVEDDDFAAYLYTKALTSHGYEVRTSHGDPESLALLAELRPAALLVDLHLGEHDGIELLQRLRAVRGFRRVPAAVITGDYFTDARVSRQLEELGIEMHLKPLWDDELLRVVAGLVKAPQVSAQGSGPHLTIPVNDSLR